MELPVNYDHLNARQKKLVREEYVRRQEGKCCHCGNPLEFSPPANILYMEITRELYPPGFFKYPVHLHHNHNTGMTIGAVHNYCNAVLFEYYDE